MHRDALRRSKRLRDGYERARHEQVAGESQGARAARLAALRDDADAADAALAALRAEDAVPVRDEPDDPLRLAPIPPEESN